MLDQIMNENFQEYAEYFNFERAIPNLYDGLKNVHRKLLWTLYTNKMTPDKNYNKNIKVIGAAMAYYVHGDASLAGALATMGQKFRTYAPLIDGHGNYGSVSSPPAAPRYIECRLSTYSNSFFTNIQKQVVEMEDNFDGTLKEPKILPTIVPNVLIMPQLGIGSGAMTSTPPHNPKDVEKLIEYITSHPNDSTTEIVKATNFAPDFPSGCEIVNKDELPTIYTNGKGSLRLRANFVWEGKKLIINNLPHCVKASTIHAELEELKEKGKLPNNVKIHNTTQQQEEIQISNINASEKTQELICLETSADTHLTVSYKLSDGKHIRLFSLKEIVDKWLKWRDNIIIQTFEYDKAHFLQIEEELQGLIKALDIIDKIIVLIKRSNSPSDAKSALESKYNFTKLQSEKIVNMKLSALTKLEKNKLINQLELTQQKIKNCDQHLNQQELRTDIITKQYSTILGQYAVPRKSKLSNNVISRIKKQESTNFVVRQIKNNIKISDSGKGVGGNKENPVYIVTVDGKTRPIKSPNDLGGKGTIVGKDLVIHYSVKENLIKATLPKHLKTTRVAQATSMPNITEVVSVTENDYVVVYNGSKAIQQFKVTDIPTTKRSAKGVKISSKDFTEIRIGGEVNNVKQKRG